MRVAFPDTKFVLFRAIYVNGKLRFVYKIFIFWFILEAIKIITLKIFFIWNSVDMASFSSSIFGFFVLNYIG